jgi:hypothetical protein
MGRVRIWAVSAAAAALVIGLVAPATGAAESASAHHAIAAAKPACTADTADFPDDTCAITALTGHSVSMTWTTTPINPYCNIGTPDPCIFEFFGTFGVSMAGGPVDKDDTISGSCPTASANPNFSFPFVGSNDVGDEGGSDDIGVANASALTCSFRMTWDPATQFPLDTVVGMTEEDGQGDIQNNSDHTFGATMPTPGPHAAFTDVVDKDEPGEYTFTDKSFSLVPWVTIKSEKWTSSDGDHGTGRVWNHTFDADGKYDVTLDVTDSSGKSGSSGKTDEVSHVVKVTDAGGSSGSSASITVKEALSPASDAGRFDLLVGKKTVKANAGDGDHGVAHDKAGAYLVSQSAKTVDLTHYGVSLSCTKNGKKDFTTKSWAGSVKVSGGDAEVCTFTDTRSTKTHCDVPQLAGDSLAAAKKALKGANCKPGKVSKPAHPKHGAKLVVGHSTPAAYAVTAKGKKVSLVLV